MKNDLYWTSYKSFEKRIIELSHSICFDDEQLNVYSAEIADLFVSICTKIESVSKDLYEKHILPFLIDNEEKPLTYNGKKFTFEKWKRKDWKFDHNCLMELNNKFAFDKKKIELKDRFNFINFGEVIIPFSDIISGGKWEQFHIQSIDFKILTIEELEKKYRCKYESCSWLKSYQSLKHDFHASIKEHGTLKNIFVSLGALFLLLIYWQYYPSRSFGQPQKNDRMQVDLVSSLFVLPYTYQVMPNFIKDSEIDNYRAKFKQDFEQEAENYYSEISYPLVCILIKERYREVEELVKELNKNTPYVDYGFARYDKLDEKDKQNHNKLEKYFYESNSNSNLMIILNAFNNPYDYYDYSRYYEYMKHKGHKKRELTKIIVGDKVKMRNIYYKNIEGVIKELTDVTITIQIVNDDLECSYRLSYDHIIDITKL
ncbi:MAG: hypothetical protein FWE13_05035 [Firmicutes bacterium]|nr:hypothetical protein [Bacillota bacterium]